MTPPTSPARIDVLGRAGVRHSSAEFGLIAVIVRFVASVSGRHRMRQRVPRGRPTGIAAHRKAPTLGRGSVKAGTVAPAQGRSAKTNAICDNCGTPSLTQSKRKEI